MNGSVVIRSVTNVVCFEWFVMSEWSVMNRSVLKGNRTFHCETPGLPECLAIMANLKKFGHFWSALAMKKRIWPFVSNLAIFSICHC